VIRKVCSEKGGGRTGYGVMFVVTFSLLWVDCMSLTEIYRLNMCYNIQFEIIVVVIHLLHIQQV
jgi:hypothetical protein